MLLPPGDGVSVWVSRDPERAWAQLGEYLLYEARTYAGWQPAYQQASAMHSHANDVESLRGEGLFRILTPEECVAYAQAQGPHAGVLLYPLCAGIPPALAWESVELYADEVLPKLRGG